MQSDITQFHGARVPFDRIAPGCLRIEPERIVPIRSGPVHVDPIRDERTRFARIGPGCNTIASPRSRRARDGAPR